MNEEKINMRNRFDIRVVATDGTYTKKILWVNRTEKVICFGVNIPGFGGHHTYHNDGEFHFRFKNNSKEIKDHISKKIPLANFKGWTLLGNISTPMVLESLPHIDFDYKKVDGLVYIDFRTIDLSHNWFNINLQLVERGKLELIRKATFCNSIHIFTFSNPWVVIQVG